VNAAPGAADAGAAAVLETPASPLDPPTFVKGSAAHELRWGLRLLGRGFLLARRYPGVMAESLIPAANAVVFPAAVAGATPLVRRDRLTGRPVGKRLPVVARPPCRIRRGARMVRT